MTTAGTGTGTGTSTGAASRIGLTAMTGSSVVFSVMAVLVRAADHLDATVFSVARFLIALVCIGVAVVAGIAPLTFVNRRLLVLRGIIGGIGVMIYYASIVHIGLAKGTVIAYSYPVFAAIIGVFVLGEALNRRTVAALGLAFVGLVLMVAAEGSERWSVGWLELLALTGAVLSGGVVVIIRKLRETDSTVSIFLAQSVAGLVLVVWPAGQVRWELGAQDWAMLAGVGVTATVGQLLMTYAYKHLPVALGGLLGMLTPLLNVAIGALVFRETITTRNGMGMLMILAACAMLIRLPRRRRRVPTVDVAAPLPAGSA